MRKPTVEKHDPVIYPRILWVADQLEGLDKVFTFTKVSNPYVENVAGYTELMEDSEYDNAGMVTCPVMHKATNLLGVLVIALDPENTTADMIPHESVHVADYIYQQLGIISQEFTEGNEAYAYLVGWAAGCISKSVTNFKMKEE